MDFPNTMIGIVSELDAKNMKIKVKFPLDETVSNWLFVLAPPGFYFMPVIGSQVIVLMDSEFHQGVAIGIALKDGEAVFTNEKYIGISVPGVEIQIDRESKEISVTAKKLKLTGDLEITGDAAITGKVKVTGQISATGEISSTTDVKAGPLNISLLLHKHLSAAPSSPTGPAIP